MDDPYVSIIIPVYNDRAFVAECVSSVLAQTLERIEIIIVDDGSTDGSGDLIARFSDSDPRVHHIRQPNRGLSSARNTGLDHARGQYVGFVDSDDYVAPQMYRTLYEEAVLRDADVIIGSHRIIRPDGTSSRPIDHLAHARTEGRVYSPRELSWRLFTLCPGAWDKLYNRTLLEHERIRFPEGMLYEDVFFVNRALLASKRIGLVNEAHYCYRKSRSGRITNRTDIALMDIFLTYAQLDPHVRRTNEPKLEQGFERAAFEAVYHHYTRIKPSLRSRYYRMMRAYLSSSIRYSAVENEFLSDTMRRRAELIRTNGPATFHAQLIPIAAEERLRTVLGRVGDAAERFFQERTERSGDATQKDRRGTHKSDVPIRRGP